MHCSACFERNTSFVEEKSFFLLAAGVVAVVEVLPPPPGWKFIHSVCGDIQST